MEPSRRWQIASPVPRPFRERWRVLHPLVAQLLYNRGLTEPEAVEQFLEGTFAPDNPFALRGIPQAVTLLRRAIARRLPIVIYGDYDTDGVTASATLMQTLQALGARVRVYIPHRETEGYGLNPQAVTRLAEEGTRVLVTVDCGIRSPDEVTLARKLGMHVVVTDHHHLGERLPPADVIVNPRQPGDRYPVQELAGVGVAFKLAQALLRANRQVPLPTTQATLQEDDLLDLVALGTVADMVPLLGENRALVKRGLIQINAARRPGLSALMDVAGVRPGHVTADTISFVLAPRLNAAGRLRDATLALQLLMAPDVTAAFPMAQELEALNRDRQAITATVQQRAREIALAGRDEVPPLLFAALEDVPVGVVGLGASRLLDEFYRPAVVMAVHGDIGRGSARSIPEFHITRALDAVSDLLVRHGGHAAAAGFTVRREHIPRLRDRLLEIARTQLGALALHPTLQVDAEVALGSLSWEVYRTIEQLRPFGYGNPIPIFVSRKVRIVQARAVGAHGQHLKLRLADECGRLWDAIAFRRGDLLKLLPPWIDLAYELHVNEWNGRTTLQLQVRDIHWRH